jgi:hypothetical protein
MKESIYVCMGWMYMVNKDTMRSMVCVSGVKMVVSGKVEREIGKRMLTIYSELFSRLTGNSTTMSFTICGKPCLRQFPFPLVPLPPPYCPLTDVMFH